MMPQSISNHTHAQPLRSTPQRSEILSRMGRPHPPLKSVLGLGSEGFSKPGPGSHTPPRTEPSEITTVTESRAGSVRVTTCPRYYVFTFTGKYFYQSKRRLKPL